MCLKSGASFTKQLSKNLGLSAFFSEKFSLIQCPKILSLNLRYFMKRAPDEPRHDKTNKVRVRPAKTQISLCIRPVWSESSLCAQWLAKDPSFLHADSEDSDQTGRMPRLMWVFAGRTVILLVLSCRGSNQESVYSFIDWLWHLTCKI